MPTLYVCMYRKLNALKEPVHTHSGSLTTTNLNSDAFAGVLFTQSLRERIDKTLCAKKFCPVKIYTMVGMCCTLVAP